MIIGIFGGNGYLGKEAVKICLAQNHEVVYLGREIVSTEVTILEKLNLIIDCGFPRDYYKIGVGDLYLRELTERFRVAQKLKVKYLYLTSFSTLKFGNSTYAKIKDNSESIANQFGVQLLRLGLVIDRDSPGGRYKELIQLVRSSPVILIPHKSWFPVMVCQLDEYLDSLNLFINGSDFREREVGYISSLTEILEWSFPNKHAIRLGPIATSSLVRLISLLNLKKLEGLKYIARKSEEF